MPQITVNITKVNIYHIAEGISVTISQHNGGTPTYEQLWASPDEAKKLDIYYREAVSDLERRLTEWLDTSSPLYNLNADAPNMSLVLNVSKFWPTRLKGLLDNRIQDYLVHAVTAGWLNDFDGLNVKQDYQAMAANDLTDIRDIVCQRSFGFDESERATDTDTKPESESLNPEQRKSDTDTKPESESLNPEQRKSDTDKTVSKLHPDAGFRHKDETVKLSSDEIPPYLRPTNMRHRDNAIVEHHDDWTDWSGTGIAFRDRMPHRPCCEPLELAGCGIPSKSCRVARGCGYTPSHQPQRPHQPHPPLPRGPISPLSPNYPEPSVTGKGWTDDPLYDREGSEHAIQHDCGEEGCDGRNVDLNWNIND